MEEDLYAARITKPPEVKKTNLTKDKNTKKIEKITKPQKNIKNKEKIIEKNIEIIEESPDIEDSIMKDDPQPLLTQPFAPKLPHQSISTNSNYPTNSKKVRQTIPINSKISYRIEEDILNRKADIYIKDLITVVPALKRNLVKAIKNSNKPIIDQLPLTFAEDDDIDTTAIYTDFFIGDIKIRAMLDTGSAKTCMAKNVADKLGLKIDAASTSVFTLGNGSKQASLGLIYDVPLNIGGNMIIPGAIEILPVCPVNLIIGNNWMNRAKAKLNLEDNKITEQYKGLKAKSDFIYTREPSYNKISDQSFTYTKNYNDQRTPTQEIDIDDDSDDSMNDTESDSDDELMMLTDEYNEISNPEEFGNIYMKASKEERDTYEIYARDDYYLPPYTQRDYELNIKSILDPFRGLYKNDFKVFCNIVNNKLFDIDSRWQPSSSYIVQRDDSLILFLVNSTNNTMHFKAKELLALIDLLYIKEIDDVHTYNIARPNVLTTVDLNCNVEASDEDIEMQSYVFDQFEEYIKDKIDISNVPENIKYSFLLVLHAYQHIFDWENNKIGNIEVFEHEIKLKADAVPKRVRPYRLSPLETESLRKELDKLLELGIIEKGGFSDWASPIIMIKKKDGSYRIVADFRYLNSQSQVMNYPISNIDELLDNLNKAYWMSQFDLRSGFFQANLKPTSQSLTTVVCPLGAYFFKKLPQGIQTSPHVFSEIMEKCFHELINQCVVLYLDDVTTYTVNKDPKEHLEDLKKTFACMDRNGIVLNPKKSHFFKDEILFLGYIVARDKIKPNPDTVAKIRDYPLPKTIKEIRSFIGLASYYRRFVNNFAKVARPLHEQLKTTSRVTWTDDATKAFHKLKDILTSEPVLSKPDFNKEFFVVTDASIEGLGAILTQKDEEDREHPIIYSSRALQGSEKNYGVSKLELLAVVWALQLYRPYLLGSHFQVTIISDHSAINGLLKSKKPTGIIARWIEILSEYNFKVVYRPGRVNESADFLSRLGY